MKRSLLSLMLTLSLILSAINIPIYKANTEQDLAPKGTVTIPSKYDLREKGLITPVKDQGRYNTSWTFAACASMESNALVLGLGTYDLSEAHLGYWTMHISSVQDESIKGEGFTASKEWYNTAGNYLYATSTLMKGFGPVTEDKAPYADITKKLPDESINWDKAVSVYACNTITADKTKTIKEAIMNNGAIALSVCGASWEDSKYTNAKTGAAYLPEWNDTYKHTDHTVVIVGWDDDYAKENFPIIPEGNGAWIVKNSWGTEVGDKGYYYLSYYDVAFNQSNVTCQYLVAPAAQSDYRYQYDGGSGLWYDDEAAAVAIAFSAKEDQTMTGVRISPRLNASGTFDKVTANIKVYKNVSDATKIESGSLIYSQYADITTAGYQLIEFDKGVNITKGEKAYVVVRFDKPIYYAFDADAELSSGKITAPAKLGETFISRDGGTWADYATVKSDKTFSLCIKVDVRNGLDREVIHRIPREDKPDNPDVPDDPVVTLGETTFYLLNNEEAKITVTWKDVEGAEGYYIYRKVKGLENEFKLLVAVYDSTKYYDIGLTIGADYTYKVIPFKGSAIGTSPEKTIRATIAAPWIMNLANVAKGQVKVTYSKVVGAKSYSVYRARKDKTYSFIGTSKTNTFLDRNAKKGKIYGYKVSVKKGNRQSALSAAKTIKVKK